MQQTGYEGQITRLELLGFSMSTANNIRTYLLTVDGYTVFGDPRESSKIVFRAYKTNIRTKNSRPTRNPCIYFVLPDRWKNDVPGSFTRLLATNLRIPRPE